MDFDFCMYRLISSKDSKKERKINGSNLLSFNEKLQALKGLDKAMCNIFRLAESHISCLHRTNGCILPYLGEGRGAA